VQSVEEKYQAWLLQQEQAGVHFTEQQRWWLDRIKETIAQSIQVTPDSLELAPFTERGGIDGAIRDLGANIQTIMSDLNERLTA
jgi:type I restriction enzyme R subunit